MQVESSSRTDFDSSKNHARAQAPHPVEDGFEFQHKALNRILPNARKAFAHIANRLSTLSDNVMNDRKSPTPGSPTNQIKAEFLTRFREFASRPEAFNALLVKVYGENINRDTAEELRQKVLQGNTQWLPEIEVLMRKP